MSKADWLRQKYIDEASLQFRTVWDLYLKFYTVFLTFNITALGLTIQFVKGSDQRLVLVLAFILQNVVASITAARISVFSVDCSKRMAEVAAEYIKSEGAGLPDDLKKPTIPGDLGRWGGLGNLLGHLLLIASWIAALFVNQPSP